MALLLDAVLILRYRIQKGPWLSLAGMMLAANSASLMSSVTKANRVGEMSETVEKRR